MWRLADLRRPLESLGLARRPLRQYDVAEWHLVCAVGLPGSEELDIDRSLGRIDEYTRAVVELTRRNYWRFSESPESYRNSEAYFCTLYLVSVLWEVCGLQYHPKWYDLRPETDRGSSGFGADSRDQFLHGITDGPGGTCGTIPFLIAAIGRRLKYPLYVVKAKNHLFVRWSDPHGCWRGLLGDSPSRAIRFNIEATNPGLQTPSDDFYRDWPKPIHPYLIECGAYLSPLMPPEEIAVSLVARATCLRKAGGFDEDLEYRRWIAALAPHDPEKRESFEWLEQRASERRPILSRSLMGR